MKPLALAAALAIAAFAPEPPKPVNYSGSWTLDKSRSTGLPAYYERVRSHRLEIDQRGWRLDVAVSVDIGAPTPDTMRFVYAMDGKETRAKTPVRGARGMMLVPTVMHATVSPDRQVHITIERDIDMNGSTFHAVSREDWQLAADGQTLTIHRADDTPRGTMRSDMVFARSGR